MRSKKHPRPLAERFLESAGILFSLLLMVAMGVYAANTLTWPSGGAPQADPDEGNVALSELSLPICTEGQIIVYNETTSEWECADAATASGATIFQSSELDISPGNSLTIAHGLSAKPNFIHAYLVNKTSNLSYSPGDIVYYGSFPYSNRGVAMEVDDTNIYIHYADSGLYLIGANGDGGTIANAKWKMVVVASTGLGGTTGAGKFRDGTDPNDAVYTSGNVGVGTTDPAAKFEVDGGIMKTTGGLIIETRTDDPSSPEDGRMWLRTDI